MLIGVIHASKMVRLLIHCTVARDLRIVTLGPIGLMWAFPRSVQNLIHYWRAQQLGGVKKKEKGWSLVLFLFGFIYYLLIFHRKEETPFKSKSSVFFPSVNFILEDCQAILETKTLQNF